MKEEIDINKYDRVYQHFLSTDDGKFRLKNLQGYSKSENTINQHVVINIY